jgi:hypothetical protein
MVNVGRYVYQWEEVDDALSQCCDPVSRSLVAVAEDIVGSTSTGRWMQQNKRHNYVKEQMVMPGQKKLPS